MRLVLPSLLVVAACASGTRAPRSCDPVPTEYALSGGVYAECEVDRRVRVTSMGRPDFSRLEPLVTSSSGCYTADFLMVVDENGIPNPRSIKLLRTNSQTYADAITPTLIAMRLEPAQKNGLKVKQLYLHKSGMAYTVTRSGTGPARPPIC